MSELRMRLCYLHDGQVCYVSLNKGFTPDEWQTDYRQYWLQSMVSTHKDTIFFFVTETTDIDHDGINYRDLLKRMVDHFSFHEGTAYLSDMYRSWSEEDGPKFSDAEWAELQKIEKEI